MKTPSWVRQMRRVSFAVAFALAGFAGSGRAETVDIQTAMLAPPPAPQDLSGGLFGSREFATPTSAALPQWTDLLQRLQAERAAIDACDANASACPNTAVAYWRAMIRNLRGQPQAVQLREVNSYINALLPYQSDSERFGRSDYWAAPLEVLGTAGDCEDFAFLKFVSLLDLGFSNDQMRVVVLKDMRRRLGHAVLAVRMGGMNIILDNLQPAPLADTQLPDYVPQYSVNLTTRWAHQVSAATLVRFAE